jgi:hypothetical protein
MNNSAEIKWVKRRSECSASVMFAKLKLEIEQDVNERQALRPPLCPYGFTLVTKSPMFSVLRQSNRPVKSITFCIENEEVIVKNSDGDMVLKASLTLNDEGECKFKIDGKERESWQFRKMALEDLFFGIDLP